MTTVTYKAVAANVRESLGGFLDRNGYRTMGGTMRFSTPQGDSTEMSLPSGLGFTIRATKAGVNITIEDRGWVDGVTGGDRGKISERQQEMAAIVAEVDKFRSLYPTPLPGKTGWGMIIIGARATGTTITGSHDKTCDRCGHGTAEWREVAGTPLSIREGRPEIMCVPCNDAWLATGGRD